MTARITAIDARLQQRCHDDIRAFEVPGINGYNEAVNWVPYDKLEEYWEKSRVEEVLASLSPVIPSKTIRHKYLRVFTILVLLNKIQYLPRFLSHALTDECWPRVERFEGWAEAVGDDDFFEDFKRKQWTLFPLEFSRHELVDRILPLERVLPFTKVELAPSQAQVVSGGGGGAKCSIITIHDSCNQLHKGGGPKSGSFLLKTYEIPVPCWDQEKAYERENEAYSLIESAGRSDNIVKFYGSFQQHGANGGSRNLLLEYVDGGTLLEYLKKSKCPQSLSDICDFWSSIVGVLRGLQKVHQVTGSDPQPSRRGIIHQDIKSDNILISRDPTSPYRFLAQLGDFGHSSTATAQGDGRLRGVDTGGNATNSAPENARHFGHLRTGPSTTTSAADIWALGCEMFDIAAWVADGYSNVDTFRNMRTEELMSNDRFKGSEYVQSYHDGSGHLKSVRDYYNLVLSQLRVNNSADQVTPKIIQVVMEHMLTTEPEKRLGPKQVEAMINNILNHHRPEQGADKTNNHASPTGGRIIPTAETPDTEQQRKLTIDQCIHYHRMAKHGGSLDDWVDTAIKSLVKRLDGRDHLFLIDDSPSMETNHKEVLRVFEGLAYVAKLLDHNGLDLSFMSSPRRVERKAKVRDLLKIISAHSYQHSPDMTEHRFDEFLDEAVVSKLRDPEAFTVKFRAALPSSLSGRKAPLTIFVFTDGCWGPDDDRAAAGIERPIKKLMDKMKRLGVGRTVVTIQFVRFGHDLVGKGLLGFLDEMGLANDCDIVDTRSIDEDVVDIFMSSISMERDRNNTMRTRDRSRP